MKTVSCPYCQCKSSFVDTLKKGDSIHCFNCEQNYLLYETRPNLQSGENTDSEFSETRKDASSENVFNANKKDLNPKHNNITGVQIATIASIILLLMTVIYIAATENSSNNQNNDIVNVDMVEAKNSNTNSDLNIYRRDSLINAVNEKTQDSFCHTHIGKKCKKIMDKLDCTQEDAIAILDGKIWLGMTIDMVKYRRGLPNDINVSNYGSGNQYQACWEDHTPSCFYYKSDGIVYAYN